MNLEIMITGVPMSNGEQIKFAFKKNTPPLIHVNEPRMVSILTVRDFTQEFLKEFQKVYDKEDAK